MPDYQVSGGGLRGYLGKIRSDWGENSRKPVFGSRLSKEGLFCKGLNPYKSQCRCEINSVIRLFFPISLPPTPPEHYRQPLYLPRSPTWQKSAPFVHRLYRGFSAPTNGSVIVRLPLCLGQQGWRG